MTNREHKKTIENIKPIANEIINCFENAIEDYKALTPIDLQLDKSTVASNLRRFFINRIKKIVDTNIEVLIDEETTKNQVYIKLFKNNCFSYTIKINKMGDDGLSATKNNTNISKKVNLTQKDLFSHNFELNLLYSLNQNSLELKKLKLVKMVGEKMDWSINLLNLAKSENEFIYSQSNFESQLKPKANFENPLIAKKYS